MKVRRLPARIAAAVIGLLSLTVGVPAQAAAPADPVLSNFDSSTPGSVSFDVSSPGAPYLRLSFNSGTGIREFTLAGDNDHVVASTWGVEGPVSVAGWACTTPTYSTTECSARKVFGSFTPTDIEPAITFSDDATLSGNQQVSITVDDALTGPLRARWVTSAGSVLLGDFLDHHGTTEIPLQPGSGVLSVVRCSDVQSRCAGFSSAASHSYTFLKGLQVTWDADVAPSVSTTRPTTQVTYTVKTSGGTWPAGTTYSADWSATNDGGDPVSGNVTGSFGPDANQIPVVISSAGVVEGLHTVSGTVTVHTVDFGDFTGPMAHHSNSVLPKFRADYTPPTVNSVTPSKATIYPKIGTDKRPGSVSIHFNTASRTDIKKVNVWSASKIVRSITPTYTTSSATARWLGTNSAGVLVPQGTYRLEAVDAAGNVAALSASVTVSHRYLIAKTLKKTVSAAGSLADQFVGKCSTLRKPGSRGWVGSIGLFTNTKCGSTVWTSSGVATLHATTLPAAESYGTVQVTAYGGAASGRPHDTGYIRYLSTRHAFVHATEMTPGVGYHAATKQSALGLIFSDHSFGWGVLAEPGNRYDVKSFTIVLTYKVLSPLTS